jgi:glycosyltransferase involved in cell wall biosynthesis
VGGIPDQVEDGRTGFLVKPGHPEEIAERVKQLLLSPELAHRLSHAASEAARSKFGLSKMCDNYLNLYEQICSSADPG